MTLHTYRLLKAVDHGRVRRKLAEPLEILEKRGLVTIPMAGAVELTSEGRQAVKLRKSRHYVN